MSWTAIAGHPGLVPRLGLQGTVLANGYGSGATAQIAVDATVEWEYGGYSFLGTFVARTVVLRWLPSSYVSISPVPADEMTTTIELFLALSSGAVQALEQARQGAGFSLVLNSSVVLVEGGEPTGPRTGDYYRSLSVRDGQDTLQVAPHDWGAVLQGWGRGIGITVLVPVGAGEPNPDRVQIIEHLRLARVKIDGADYSGSMACARKALELLRRLFGRVAPLPPTRERDPLQRIYAVVESLFSFASAPAHIDEPIKGFVPDRADAVAVLGCTASVAQQTFAWLDK